MTWRGLVVTVDVPVLDAPVFTHLALGEIWRPSPLSAARSWARFIRTVDPQAGLL